MFFRNEISQAHKTFIKVHYKINSDCILFKDFSDYWSSTSIWAREPIFHSKAIILFSSGERNDGSERAHAPPKKEPTWQPLDAGKIIRKKGPTRQPVGAVEGLSLPLPPSSPAAAAADEKCWRLAATPPPPPALSSSVASPPSRSPMLLRLPHRTREPLRGPVARPRSRCWGSPAPSPPAPSATYPSSSPAPGTSPLPTPPLSLVPLSVTSPRVDGTWNPDAPKITTSCADSLNF